MVTISTLHHDRGNEIHRVFSTQLANCCATRLDGFPNLTTVNPNDLVHCTTGRSDAAAIGRALLDSASFRTEAHDDLARQRHRSSRSARPHKKGLPEPVSSENPGAKRFEVTPRHASYSELRRRQPAPKPWLCAPCRFLL